jgi:hypothetical protein
MRIYRSVVQDKRYRLRDDFRFKRIRRKENHGKISEIERHYKSIH